ncbi:MAG: hypothetical protein KC433_19850 [Anaerolineales bacterium]|nr:hypothetical protein [Anaerolineales bacterium]MCB8938099.1 hypothetical protein [Ardenticatenaceae bacterium]
MNFSISWVETAVFHHTTHPNGRLHCGANGDKVKLTPTNLLQAKKAARRDACRSPQVTAV